MGVLSPHGHVCGLFAFQAPAVAPPYSLNRWPRPRSSARLSSAMHVPHAGADPLISPATSWCMDGCRDGGSTPPTTGPTPFGTASAAPGSRRGSRRSFCCGVCAVAASSRSSSRARQDSLQEGSAQVQQRQPPLPVRSRKLGESLSGRGRNPAWTSMCAGLFRCRSRPPVRRAQGRDAYSSVTTVTVSS